MSTTDPESARLKAYSVAQLRADFLAQPPKVQRETLERARRLAREQPKSWLAANLERVYGRGM